MSLFSELKRRNVIRVGLAYIVLSWVLIQVADVLFETLGLPVVWERGLLALLLLGFIPALVFSWAYELTPDGLKREGSADAERAVNEKTGQRLDLITIAMVLVGVGLLIGDRMIDSEPGREVLATAKNGADIPAGKESIDDQAGSEEPSIAVLPFVNLSANPENEYFADGLSEELLNQLAQIPDLLVAGRTSSFSFKGRNEDLRDIGTTLGVSHVLEGSVRRQEQDVRVTAQLIRVSDGFHLWSENYDRTLDDVFAIQDDIARNVANALKIVLDDSAWQAMQDVGVRNVDAFVAYQKGRELYELAHGRAALLPTLEEGMVYFQRAIELVPSFGAAYWSMADYYAHILIDGASDSRIASQALADLRNVLDEAYEHSGSTTRRAFINVDRALFSDDWSTLPARIRAAIETEGCPDPTWIEVAMAMGYAEDLIPVWRRLVQCEPLSSGPRVSLARAQLVSGHPEEALRILDETQSRMGIQAWSSAVRQTVLLSQGRIEEARAIAPQFIESSDFGGATAEVRPLAVEGRIPEAVEAFSAWEQRYGKSSPLAFLAMVGDRPGANEIAAGVDRSPAGPFKLMVWTAFCSCGAPFDLKATPNLKARLEEADAPWPPPELIDFPAKDW